MRIATFNINLNNQNFPERIYSLSEELKEHRFDIICLQEDYASPSFHSSKFLNLELDYHTLSTSTREKERNTIQSSSNLTILSKYPITLLDEIYIHQGKKHERCCQVCEINKKGKRFLLLNTKLCHLSSRNRIEHLQEILLKLKDYKHDYVFFGGNFNALPSFKEIQMVLDEGFEFINENVTHEDKVMIDYLFYKCKKRRIQIKSDIILKNHSDHYCLSHHIKGML